LLLPRIIMDIPTLSLVTTLWIAGVASLALLSFFFLSVGHYALSRPSEAALRQALPGAGRYAKGCMLACLCCRQGCESHRLVHHSACPFAGAEQITSMLAGLGARLGIPWASH